MDKWGRGMSSRPDPYFVYFVSSSAPSSTASAAFPKWACRLAALVMLYSYACSSSLREWTRIVRLMTDDPLLGCRLKLQNAWRQQSGAGHWISPPPPALSRSGELP
jgi:hypothetical protein